MLGHPRPWRINLLLGTADAFTNSTPVVAISAQVGLNRIYKESHQSVDLVSMFSAVTKWADLILTPGLVPEMVRRAFKLAQTERPGSVYSGYRRTSRTRSSQMTSNRLKSTGPELMSPRPRRSNGRRRC